MHFLLRSKSEREQITGDWLLAIYRLLITYSLIYSVLILLCNLERIFLFILNPALHNLRVSLLLPREVFVVPVPKSFVFVYPDKVLLLGRGY